MLYNYYVDVYFVYEINVYINVYNIHCTMHIGQSRGGDILPQELMSNSSFAHSCASTSERLPTVVRPLANVCPQLCVH